MRDSLDLFSSDQRGQIALMSAAIMGGTALLAFAAVDLHRAVSAKSHVQNAADAAALAAASVTGSNAEAVAHATFNANMADHVVPGVAITRRKLTINGNRFRYQVSAKQNTSGSAIVGREFIAFDADAEAVRPQFAQAEVAISLDVTNSMGIWNDWSAAVAATRQALDIMRAGTASGQFKVTFVPTTDRVNIGAARSAWLDGPAPAGWNGCVRPREEAIAAFAYALDDDPPIGANQFQPVLSGDVLGGPGSGGFGLTCKGAVLGPTTDLDAIESNLAGITLGGTGRWDEGLAWAWRALSPKWNSHWGVPGTPSTSPHAKKILIFITDGASEAYTYEVGADTAHSWGWNKRSQMGWDHLLDLCERIKNEGIELHVLQAGSEAHAVAPLRACASSPEHYRTVTELDDWAEAFQFAAESFTEVRLVK